MKKQFLFFSLFSIFIAGLAADQQNSFLNRTYAALQSPIGTTVILISAALLSRPLVGYFMQILSQDDIEKYNIWELISFHTGKDFNDLPEADVNIGGFRFKATMLDTEAVKKYGILGASFAVINATDPALSRAFVERIRNAAHLKKSKAAREELEDQKNQWVLNLQGNLLNLGLQTRIAISEMVLTTTGIIVLGLLQQFSENIAVGVQESVADTAQATTPTV